jgi:hypothetical protein
MAYLQANQKYCKKIMPNKEYKGLRLHTDRIEACLLAFGVQSLVVTDETPKIKRFVGQHEGKEVFFKVFQTDKGATIGYSTGKDRAVFDTIATEIVDKCSFAGKHTMSVSIPKVPAAVLDQIDAYLETAGAKRQCADEINKLRILKRWQGPRLDKIALTYYTSTCTLLVQGINAHLASLVMDMLRVVMPSSESLRIDLEAFAVPLTVTEAKSQIAARLPASHDWLSDPVRRMLSSSHASMQTTQALEDYCGVATPALRGLEGFLKQLYCTKGAVPEENVLIGEWFEQQAGKWVMREVPALHVGHVLAPILAEGYSIFHAERHTLSHMGFDPENTRLIENIDEARSIVNRVLDFVESSCAKIRS